MVALDDNTCLDIARNVAAGMAYMHMTTPPLVHGLLRASNVLIDSKFTAKVVDGGMRSLLAACQPDMGNYPLWMAPEVLRSGECTPAGDVYSFGMLLFELWTRHEPYAGEVMEEVVRKVSEVPTNAMRVLWKRPVVSECDCVPPAIAELMELCWHQDPACRPSFKARSAPPGPIACPPPMPQLTPAGARHAH